MDELSPDFYIPRIVDRRLDELLSGLPAISLEGPRAVGKTETALRVSAQGMSRFVLSECRGEARGAGLAG